MVRTRNCSYTGTTETQAGNTISVSANTEILNGDTAPYEYTLALLVDGEQIASKDGSITKTTKSDDSITGTWTAPDEDTTAGVTVEVISETKQETEDKDDSGGGGSDEPPDSTLPPDSGGPGDDDDGDFGDPFPGDGGDDDDGGRDFGGDDGDNDDDDGGGGGSDEPPDSTLPPDSGGPGDGDDDDDDDGGFGDPFPGDGGDDDDGGRTFGGGDDDDDDEPDGPGGGVDLGTGFGLSLNLPRRQDRPRGVVTTTVPSYGEVQLRRENVIVSPSGYRSDPPMRRNERDRGRV